MSLCFASFLKKAVAWGFDSKKLIIFDDPNKRIVKNEIVKNVKDIIIIAATA